MSEEIKLSSGDRALLKAAQTGEGAVEVTSELLDAMREGMKQRDEHIKATYPKLVEDCPYETRLAVAAWVFEAIVAHAKHGGTFRYLIYERLGFDLDAYYPLYCAGGMTISNEFDLSEAPRGPTP